MVNMRKRVLAVLVGVALVLGVAACGDDDETPTTTIGDGTTSTEPIGS